MNWDPIWEKIFSSSGWGRYPNEELIRFMARNFYRAKNRKEVRVLELGCGNAANLWYLAKEGFDAVGIDGSHTAIDLGRKRLKEENQNAECIVGDVNNIGKLFGAAEFDAVIDVGCLQCNPLEEVRSIIGQCERILRPGGRMFALVVTRGSWGDQTGSEIAPGTYADISEGPLKGRGINHFFSRQEVDDLWQAFHDRSVEYVARSFENGSKEYRTWTVDAALGR